MGELRPIKHVLGGAPSQRERHEVHVWSLRVTWEGTESEAGDAVAGLADDLLRRGFSVMYEPKQGKSS